MQHSQLSITYPDCPFIWDYNDLTRTFDVEYVPMIRDDFIDEIIDELFKSEEGNERIDMDKLERDDVISYISNITSNSNSSEYNDQDKIFHKITYHKVTQKIPSSLINLWINFHCACYCHNKSSYLDSDYETDISWTVVSLIGNVKPKNDTIRIKSEQRRFEVQNFNNSGTSISDARPKHRGLYIRTYNPNSTESNSISAIREIQVDDPEVDNQSIMSRNATKTIAPRVHQIEFTKNARYSAHVLRSNLLSEGKQRRLKNLPQFVTNQQKKADLSLKGVSNKIINDHNDIIKASESSIERGTYDMIDEKISIHKINGIYRFSPNTVGRIQFKGKKNTKVKFITILRQNDCLSLSLNIINCT